MAKVKVDMRGAIKKVERIRKSLKAKPLLNAMASIVVDDIKRNTRTKRGFTESQLGSATIGKREKLPALKESTQRTRRGMARYNTTTDVYSPARSNLSFTGQLIQSVTYKIKRGIIQVFAKGTRKPYRTRDGRAVKGRKLTNDALVGHLEDKGFYFLGIDKLSAKKIRALIVREIRRLIVRR